MPMKFRYPYDLISRQRCLCRFSTLPTLRVLDAPKQNSTNEEVLEFLQEGKTGKVSSQRRDTTNLIERTQREASATLSQSTLPPSPLTDPKLTFARRRFKQTKAKQTKFKDLDTWRQKWHTNPYALALTSPVRKCNITEAHLPKEFLLQFGLITDPRSGRKWQLPRFIGDEPSRDRSSADLRAPEDPPWDGGTDGESGAKGPVTAKGTKHKPSEGSQPLPRTLQSSYFLSTARTMRVMSQKSLRAFRQILPFRWRDDKSLDSDSIVWREDMSTFILSELRERITTQLIEIANAESFALCKDMHEVDAVAEVGAVLQLPTEPDMNLWKDDAPFQDELPETLLYSIIRWKDSFVPKYDVLNVLGFKLAAKLAIAFREKFDDGSGLIAVKKNVKSVKLLMQLWKLMGYLGEGRSVEWDRRERARVSD